MFGSGDGKVSGMSYFFPCPIPCFSNQFLPLFLLLWVPHWLFSSVSPVSGILKAIVVYSSLLYNPVKIICCILCSQEFNNLILISPHPLCSTTVESLLPARHSLGFSGVQHRVLVNLTCCYPGENTLLLGKEDWKTIPLTWPPCSRV